MATRYSSSARSAALLTMAALLVTGCGRRKDLDRGEELEPAVLGGGGGAARSGGQPQVVTTGKPPTTKLVEKCTIQEKPLPVFDIVPVTQIVEGVSGIPGVDNTDLPFNVATLELNPPTATADRQTPFHFSFDYPANNYQFTEAHLVIDTSRDSSDTEAIFVDGVFSGRPPLNMVNTSSPMVTDAVYEGSGAPELNTYYIDFSLAHYKQLTKNSFDLNLDDLLKPTSKTAKSVLSDGQLNVVTGDDSPVYQAYLVIRGLTISSDELSCKNSDTISFTNVYLHNDGNTINEKAFYLNLGTPYTDWNNGAVYDGFEMNFDAPLPKVPLANITITSAKLRMTVKRDNTVDPAAIVINGVGVSQDGFDRSTATDVVESWDDDAKSAFNTFMSNVPTTASGASRELDLIALFGASKVKSLLSQGKLNVSVAGNLHADASAATSSRKLGTAVNGPELLLDGTWFAEVCNVPDNPNSPLAEDGFTPPEPETEEVCEMVAEEIAGDQTTTVVNDGKGPVIASLQVLEISSTSATIVWATDEGATSQVRYGILSVSDNETAEDSTLTTFHQVKLTGLKPYKFYNVQVVSKDKYGNESVSDVKVFQTLR